MLIENAMQMREKPLEIIDGLRPVFSQQILPAPAIFRLKDPDIVAPAQQLGSNASQKMRVAVIPIGYQRVREDYEAQA